jgi:type IV pilus assembly protein PilB
MRRVPIGQLLVEGGSLDSRQLRAALDWQRRWGGKLGVAVMYLGLAKEADVVRALGAQFEIPVVDLSTREISPEVLALVPHRILEARRVVPIELLSETRRGPLVVATSDPLDLQALDEVAFASGKLVRPVLAARTQIDMAIARCRNGTSGHSIELPPVPLEDMELVHHVRTQRFWN